MSSSTTTPATFKWTGPANDVKLAGTFNDWKADISLVRENNEFSAIVALELGKKYYYKFVVDGQWTVDTNSLIEKDESNIDNNVITVTEPAIVVVGQKSENATIPAPTPAPAPAAELASAPISKAKPESSSVSPNANISNAPQSNSIKSNQNISSVQVAPTAASIQAQESLNSSSKKTSQPLLATNGPTGNDTNTAPLKQEQKIAATESSAPASQINVASTSSPSTNNVPAKAATNNTGSSNARATPASKPSLANKLKKLCSIL